MTELLRQWILSVTCGAMLAALLQSFLPRGGGTEKAGRLAGGLVLLLAAVQPLIGLNEDMLTLSVTEYRLAESGYTEELEETNRDFLKEIIEEQTEAYISDKAGELGVNCKVHITYEWGENEIPYPTEVRIRSAMDQEAERRMSRLIEAELGVPADRQVYERLVE